MSVTRLTGFPSSLGRGIELREHRFDLLLVVARLHRVGGHNQQAVPVHGKLSVVA